MKPPTVLLADDDAHITFIVAKKLDTAGFTVFIASDGEEALEMAKDILPSLIITDLQMPRMSGLEFCRALSRDPETSRIPVIMLTARGYVLEDHEIAETNIRRVMSKPFSAREVLNDVCSILKLDLKGREAA
jgi:DNA-binding response OmpR family regulator